MAGYNLNSGAHAVVGGGTDLYVQKHAEMKYASIHFMNSVKPAQAIWTERERCFLSREATVTDMLESAAIRQYFPAFSKMTKLVSSTPIRNMATIAGNFVNASPIGDFTIFFLANNASLHLTDGKTKRILPLRSFYNGYKQLNKRQEEYIETISFDLPNEETLFNFEKVSKRTHLDIASVNSALSLEVHDNTIVKAALSAGGVGPVPLYLVRTSAFLQDKEVTGEIILSAIEMAQSEISPISDARGTSTYKRLLLSQLIKAHFITLFPGLRTEELIHHYVAL